MAKSRYSNTAIISSHHYATFSLPVLAKGYRNQDLLANVRTHQYTVNAGDRIDHLSARFFNDDQYWWVIALINGIIYPFSSGGFKPGQVLKIPYDLRDVLDKFLG